MKVVLACALVLGMLSGCTGRGWLPYARELGDTALLRTMGLDRVDEHVELTVATGSRPGGQDALVLSAAGASVPAAALAVQSLGDSYIYYGHVDQMLVGEELAVRGLGEVIDYLAREPKLGLGVQLWAVQGSAGRVIHAAGGQGVPERLSQLNTDSRLGAAGLGCSAAQLVTVLAREGSTYLPALALASAREGDGGQGDERVVPNGYAILRQGKLVCWADDETARGIELMEENAYGHVTVLSLEDDEAVSLELDRVRTRCGPVFRDGELTGLEVVCDLSARVVQTGRRLSEADFKRLQRHMELQAGDRIVQAIELGQYWDADFLWLERRAQLARPDRKADIRAQWGRVFRTLDIRVEVNGTVDRSFGVMSSGR